MFKRIKNRLTALYEVLTPGEYSLLEIDRIKENYAHLDSDLSNKKNTECLENDRFKRAYQLSKDTDSWADYFNIPWRVYINLWAASYANKLEGDFVECGVNRGGFSRGIVDYIDFKNGNKKFFLYDTFKGIVPNQASSEEKHLLDHNKRYEMFDDNYEYVKKEFKDFNVEIIKGIIPESLPKADIDKVCYLSIDMNLVYPERQALEYFWPKVVKGGIIVLDDHAHYGFEKQKKSNDEFFAQFDLEVLTLPTGQGVVIKP